MQNSSVLVLKLALTTHNSKKRLEKTFPGAQKFREL